MARGFSLLAGLAGGCVLLFAGACADSSSVATPGASPSSQADTVQPPPATLAVALTPSPTAAPASITLVAVGDVMLGRSVGDAIASGGAPVFDDALIALFSAADIAVANVESPISENGAPQAKAYAFRAPPEAATVLAAAGFDVAALANNHALDYGPEALADTRELLNAAGILAVGAGPDAVSALAPVVVERSGIRVAFVSFVDAPPDGSFFRAAWEAGADSAGVAWGDTIRLAESVAAARMDADVVVVMLHFGYEFHTEPSESQKLLARAAIDAGAALVVGSHPHVVQDVEPYRDGLIAYSLGNFVFDGFAGLVDESAVLRVTFSGSRLTSWEMIPVRIDYSGRPALFEP